MAKKKTLLNSVKNIKRREFLKIAATAAAVVAVPGLAQVQTDVGTLDKEQAGKGFPSKPPYSPYAGRNFPTRPFFGDTHTHTSFSFDAGAFGARLGPADAYRFAKGEEVMASSGQRAKLSRPLDFLVVADHSDNMGFFPDLLAGKPELARRPTGPQVVRHDPVRQGRGRRRSTSSACSRKAISERADRICQARPAYRSRLAAKRSMPRKRPTSRDDSRPSSAMNGRRTPAATIFTATSSSAITASTPAGRALHDA